MSFVSIPFSPLHSMSVLCFYSLSSLHLVHSPHTVAGPMMACLSLSRKMFCSKCMGKWNTRNLCKSIGTIYASMVRTPFGNNRMGNEVMFGRVRRPNEYGRWTWCFLLNAGTKHLRCVFYFMYTDRYEAIYYICAQHCETTTTSTESTEFIIYVYILIHPIRVYVPIK